MAKVTLKKAAPQEEPEENGQAVNGIGSDSTENPAGRSSGFAFTAMANETSVPCTVESDTKLINGFNLNAVEQQIPVAQFSVDKPKKIQMIRPVGESEKIPLSSSGKIKLSRSGKLKLSRASTTESLRSPASTRESELNRKLLLKKPTDTSYVARKLTPSRSGNSTASSIGDSPISVADKERILIVDDEVSVLKVLSHILKSMGYETISTSNGESALEYLNTHEFNLMITDYRLGSNMDGLELLKEVHAILPKLPVVMISAFASVKVALQVLKEGGFDFVTKPFKMDVLKDTVRNAISHGCMYSIESMAQQDMKLHFGKIVGEDPKMIEIFSLMKRVVRTDATVLIQGEKGTGKSTFAEVLHQCSKRNEKPFLTINCSLFDENDLSAMLFGGVGAEYGENGALWAANGGTIFIADIDKMNFALQHKLLTLIQQKYVATSNGPIEIDVRLILSSEQPIKSIVVDGKFEKELAMRICTFTLDLPPLRHRVHDIPHLVNFYCYQKSDELGFEITWDNIAMNKLLNYSWPGNVNELRQALDRAMEKCQDGVLTEDSLPEYLLREESSHNSMPVNPAMGKSLRNYLKEEASKSSALDSSRSLKNLRPGG